MPTYGYLCPACGHEYEKLQKISDSTRVKCPRCGKRGKRLISGGAGIVFKGSGFYETDYKRAATSEKKEPAETAAAASGKDSDSSEKKPSDAKKSKPDKKKGGES